MPAERGPAVGLMSRAPEPGRTKSRLAAAIGDDAAARLAEAMLLDAADALRPLEGWHAALFIEPPDAVADLGVSTGIVDARPQAPGDLGARMLAALHALAADGHAPLVLVGADIPTLAPRHFRDALVALDDADVVFGPAADGGYYLVGMWEPQPALFEGGSVEWGGAGVLATSERLAAAAGLRTARLSTERDIDTPEDLAWLRDRPADLPARTAEALRTLARR